VSSATKAEGPMGF